MTPSPFRRALRNVGWLLAGKGVGAVLSLIYLGLATRSLGLDGFGQFTLILSTGQAVAGFVTFQSWQIIIRYGVALLQDGRMDALGRLARFTILLDLAAALIGCVIALVAILLLSAHLGWSPQLERRAWLFCAILLLSTRSTAVGILRLHDKFNVGAAADAVTPITRFIGAVIATVSGATVTGFLIAWAVAEIATVIAYWIAAYRTDRSFMGPWREARTVPADHPGLTPFALTVNINATLNNGSKQLLIVLLGVVAGPAAAGAYRLAFQLSQALARLADMFSRAVFPEFTRTSADPSPDAFKTLYRQAARFTLISGAIICILAPIVSKPVLSLVGGSEFADAYVILVLLSIATAFEVMGTGFEPVLLGIGRTRTIMGIRIVATILLFGTAAVTLTAYGGIGAAASTLLASAAALAGFMLYAHRAVQESSTATARL